MARPCIPHQAAPLPVSHHYVHHFFCCVGRILAADRYRPVPQVPPCLGGEGGSFPSFHPWERTEVSHLYLLLWCKCSGSADFGILLLSVDVDRKRLDLLVWYCSFACFGIHILSVHNTATPFLFHFSFRRWRRRNRTLWSSVPECLGLVFHTGVLALLWRPKLSLQQWALNPLPSVAVRISSAVVSQPVSPSSLLTWGFKKKKQKNMYFVVLRRVKCRSSSEKLVKACRNLSSSESMRAFPVCSLQLAASSCSSPPSLPLSPLSVPPFFCISATSKSLWCCRSWPRSFSSVVIFPLFSSASHYVYLFYLLLPCTGVSSLCSI